MVRARNFSRHVPDDNGPDYFEGYEAANGFARPGQVDGAHTFFAQRYKSVISAEVLVSGCCGTGDRTSGLFSA